MAGNIKVGGNTVLTHTGAVGAGTVTLKDQSGNAILTDDGTAVSIGNLRLPTTGGIKDSSGNDVLSEAGGVVTLKNATLNSSVIINAGSNVNGIGQLIGISYISAGSTAGNQVTLESSKSYHVIQWSYQSAVPSTYVEYTELSTDSSGNVTITNRINVDSSSVYLESTSTNLVRIGAPASSTFIRNAAFIFEQGSNFDAS